MNALFFTGFGISSVMGVVFNNTVVPYMGWDAMFILLGCFTLISFIMLLFFRPVRGSLIPFDEGIDYFDRNGEDFDQEKKKKRHKKRRSSKDKKGKDDEEGQL